MEVWFGFYDLNPSERKRLGWIFSEIGTPSGLGLRRDERERESAWTVVWTHNFQEDLSVDATEDLMMRIYYK